MKKIMTLMLGLTMVLGTASMFAQDTKDTTKTKKVKKSKKTKKGDDKMDHDKMAPAKP